MIVIITGASSFIGKAAVKKFDNGENEVIAFRHSFEEEPEKLPEQLDVWLHFAWAGKGSEGRSDAGIQKFNVEMSMRALKKAEELGCERFLFAGSQAEYGRAGGSEYGRAKALFSENAEKYLREKKASMLFVHLRIFSVYGPCDREGTLLDIITSKNNEPLILGPCTQQWNYLYIDDLADALYLIASVEMNMLEKAGCGQLHQESAQTAEEVNMLETSGFRSDRLIMDIGGMETAPLSDFVKRAAKVCGCTERLRFGERSNNAEGAADLVPDLRKLRELGFSEKTDFETGIKNILEYKANQDM